jgi:hypothetical protein
MYFITATTERGKEHRCFGYYVDLYDAKDAVLGNMMDIHECLYTYVVIENIEEGIHGECSYQKWFEWKENKWSECETPNWAKGIINWAIG